ncbi:Hypothetical protein R9X50_00584000 [Acrodontium crateriforme]|uniref:Transcription factor CBF/NF-Y/archaeal histone domain-containing protein n=1 Tax=Acrodontium crateriforme TaxID=150365 RepID=A0AAQ3RDD8_9PEZI|nr:Hypothetical protein R9X50_00584000 [Acrodontium crateriforme]
MGSSYSPPQQSSYAPLSPDLSGIHPSGPTPQSPDLSAISQPAVTTATYHPHPDPYHQPRFHPLPQYSPQHARQPSYQDPAGAFHPPHHQLPQHYDQSQTMPPTTRGIKHEPDHFQMNGNPFHQPPAPQWAQPMKPELPPSDPTLGIVLKTSFPVARIKRIMQADEDVGKVAQVTPHVVSRALELFMIKLISASAQQARGNNAAGKGPRRVLAQHMKKAILADNTYDFLAEIVTKVPDAPSKAKKEAASDSEDAKPKRRGKKKKDSGDEF